MEEKVELAIDYLCDAFNMMMVLTDSLELAFHNSKDNDYQYTVAKNVLNELNEQDFIPAHFLKYVQSLM